MITAIPSEMSPRDVYFMMTSLVVPRPIAWISTLGKDGCRNLAPYSHFTNCSSDPPIVLFCSNGVKHTLANILDNGEFVINAVTHEVRHQMRISGAIWPVDADEIAKAGLTAVDSEFVRPPRLREAKAAMECRLRDVVPMGECHVVFGDIVCFHVCFHVEDELMASGRVVTERLRPVGKLDGSNYATVHAVERLGLPAELAAEVGDFGKAGR